MELKTLKTKCNLELPSNLDGSQASALHDVLKQGLNENKPLSIICAKTERISITCAQLIFAAQKSFSEQGVGFQLEKVNDSVKKQFQLIGLSKPLDLED